jgi:asparagine synthase (glutamine-hydrolysing)
MNLFKQAGFKPIKPSSKPLKVLIKELKDLLIQSVKKLIPKKGKVGVLFSGGVDSTIICLILQKKGVRFTCYTSGLKNSPDMLWAEKIARIHKFKLKTILFDEKKVKNEINKICNIIKSGNPVKVGVAIPLYFAIKEAKKDGVETIFSGLGSEEIFAGYQRFEGKKNVNLECVKGLNTIYERDLERDSRLADYFKFKLALPFLDKKLIDYSLRIPGKYKINKEYKKIILRKAAEIIGVHESVAWRRKKAAQYGSKSDKVLQRLSKGFDSKTAYLHSVYNTLRLGVLFSSGKDSNLALYKMKRQGYISACLITVLNENPDSYMFHQPVKKIVELQSKAMNIPVVFGATKGVKEEELKDLKKLIKSAKKKYELNGVVTGALFINYQKTRIERVCKELGLQVFSPLWRLNQKQELLELLKSGFKFVFTQVAALGLNKKWLNKVITKKHVDNLVLLEKKYGLNVAGEGGEYESLVLFAPFYTKKLKIVDSEILEEDENTAKLIIKRIRLV